MPRLSRLLAAAALPLAFLAAAAKETPQAQPAEPARGALIRFEGVVSPDNEQYLRRKLEAAKEMGANVVIVEIESRGGRLDSSQEIAEMLRDVDWARTVAYVPHEALSGAAIVALSCDEIAMGPHARLGDAGPIYQGQDSLFRYVPEKLVSDFAQFMHDLAASKGRSPALAEAMVDKKLVVYRVENVKTHKPAYMSQGELDAQPGEWKKLGVVPQSGNGRFLTVIGKEAVELGLAQAIASSRDELRARYNLEGELPTLEPGALDTAVQILNWPFITGLLLVVGLTGLYIEFTSPGVGFGGLLAAVCFTAFFWSHFLGGTATWLAAALFLLGVAFLAVELFILPGFAVAGLLGAVLVLAGLLMAMQGFFIPHTSQELTTLAQSMLVVFVAGAAFVVAAAAVSKRMGSLPVFSRLMLPPPEPAAAGLSEVARADGPQVRDEEPLPAIGLVGVAESDLRPGGKARFGRRRLDVVTDGEFLPKGSRIVVVQISGNRLVVSEASGGSHPGRNS